MGDQAVPAGRDRSAPRRGFDHAPVCSMRSPSATPTRHPTSCPTWIGAAKAALGPAAAHPRAPLPARRGHVLGRRPGRLLRPVAHSPPTATTPTTSSSAASTSWPSRPTSSPAAHQQVILPDLNAGCSMADMADIDAVEEAWEALADGDRRRAHRPRHLHELLGRPEGLRRPPRRRRVHLVQRPGRARVGPRPRPATGTAPGATRCSSSPTSTWAATPATSSAGATRDMRVWNPRLDMGGLDDADVKDATLLLWKGHCSVHQRFRPEHVDGLPGRAPRRHRPHPPRVRPRGGRDGRRGGLDRLHHPGRRRRARPGRSSASAPRSTSSSGSTTSTPTRPSCRSTRSCARARPCSGSTPPTCAGCSRAWWRARS